MPIKQIPLILQPKQFEIGQLFFAKGPEAATTIGGGGARAGGKSGGLRRIMLERRQQRPKTFGCIVRRTWPDLDRNHVQRYFIEFPEMREMWHEGKKKFILPNGSEIHCMFAENQTEVDQKFWGPEFYDIMIDQAEQFSEQELITIKTCNRWPHAGLGECKTGHFFNPGGVGTEYLRRIYWQKRFKGNEDPSDYRFVHMFGWDNYAWFEPLGISAKEVYALPDQCDRPDGDGPEYLCCRFHLFVNRTAEGRKLDALPPTLRAGHLLGSFESFAGQYFAGVWDESRLILTAEQEAKLIQPWWNRWMSHDHGFVHHACILWWASGKVSPKLFKDVFGVDIPEPVTVVVVYRNLTLNETEEGELVRIARRTMTLDEFKTCSRYFLSPDANEKDSKGNSARDTIDAELTRREKMYANGRDLLVSLPPSEPADNSRIGGWRFLYSMMKKTNDVLAGKMNVTRQDDDYDDVAGYGYSLKTPLLLVSGQCEDVIEAVPMAVRDNLHAGKSEDVLKTPTKSDDVIDSLRYGAKTMLNPRKTPLKVEAAEKRQEMEEHGRSLTEVAIAMRKFEMEAKRRGHLKSQLVR